MDVEDDQPPEPELESREPSLEDLVDLCRQLNRERFFIPRWPRA